VTWSPLAFDAEIAALDALIAGAESNAMTVDECRGELDAFGERRDRWRAWVEQHGGTADTRQINWRHSRAHRALVEALPRLMQKRANDRALAQMVRDAE
jgi:hypothetical protein